MAKQKGQKPMAGQEEIEAKADKARKAKVDADNQKAAAELKKKQAALTKAPLTDDEKAFMSTIASKMNKGRAIDQPSAADIRRYAMLKERVEIK
jgi:hypothetical protein